MSFEKIKEQIDKMLKDKKFFNLFVVVIVLGIVLILYSFFTENKRPDVNPSEGTVNVNAQTGQQESLIKDEYEKEQTAKLENILKKMKGVGNVEVMISFESGEIKVPAYDNNTQTTTTEEKDGEGGKRVNEQKNDGSKVVMASDGSSNSPFVTKVYKPKVISVMVMAEGATSSKTKYDIEKAVSDLYNLSFDKVNVYPMGN